MRFLIGCPRYVLQSVDFQHIANEDLAHGVIRPRWLLEQAMAFRTMARAERVGKANLYGRCSP